jgi:hypothetical protein
MSSGPFRFVVAITTITTGVQRDGTDWRNAVQEEVEKLSEVIYDIKVPLVWLRFTWPNDELLPVLDTTCSVTVVLGDSRFNGYAGVEAGYRNVHRVWRGIDDTAAIDAAGMPEDGGP